MLAVLKLVIDDHCEHIHEATFMKEKQPELNTQLCANGHPILPNEF